MSIAADISSIQTDVRWIRERAEADLERFERIEGRLKAVEDEARSTRSWAAGVVATVIFLAALRDWLLPVLKGLLATLIITSVVAFASLASGCGAIQSRALQNYRWYEPEVQYVINQDMPPACVAAAEEAELFWSQLGVDYLKVRYEPGSWRGFNHCPEGSICVTVGEQENTGGLTWARTWQHDRGALAAAEIEFNRATCQDVYDGPRMAIHELGHGLGLDDLYAVPRDIGNPMFYALVGIGFKVTDEQLQWVRP